MMLLVLFAKEQGIAYKAVMAHVVRTQGFGLLKQG